MKNFLSSADGRREALDEDEKVPSRISPTAPESLVSAGSNKRHRAIRTPRLTVEVGRTIVGAIAAGNFPSVACRLAGVSMLTLENWLERGDKGKQPHKDFADAYRRAELDDEMAHVAILKNAAPDDWRACDKYLAKRYPERWSDHAARLAALGPEGAGATGADVAAGLHITLNLGSDEDWRPDPCSVEARERQELEDHRARERDIEVIDVLSSTPIKDEL